MINYKKLDIRMKWIIIILLLIVAGCTAIFVTRSKDVDIKVETDVTIDDEITIAPKVGIGIDSSIINGTDSLPIIEIDTIIYKP